MRPSPSLLPAYLPQRVAKPFEAAKPLEAAGGREGITQSETTQLPAELHPGLLVRLVGLQAKAELNGLQGTLVAHDKAKDRWQVKFRDGTKLLKAGNLEVLQLGRPQLPAEPLSPEAAVEWVTNAPNEFATLLLPLQLEEDRSKIRRQYRQISLLVHPDKNPHPAAHAAFKKLFGAMQTLSEPLEQRAALRRARQGLGSGLGAVRDTAPWWDQATVDEMEESFRDLERQYSRMGFFEAEQLWISPEAAHRLLQRDLTIFLDARDVRDFEVSHVHGAHSLPGHTLEQLAGLEFTKTFGIVVQSPEQSVVVYSDNGSQLSRCAHVAQALRLRVLPERVLRLEGGLNAWKRLGLPVDGDARALFAGKVLGAQAMRLGT